MMTFSGKETDGSDYSKQLDEGYVKAKRNVKTMRMLNEMDIHTTMVVNNSIHVLRVIGGWVYFHRTGDGTGAAFVPERRM